MENENVIELTKPKRGRPSKASKEAESVIPEPVKEKVIIVKEIETQIKPQEEPPVLQKKKIKRVAQKNVKTTDIDSKNDENRTLGIQKEPKAEPKAEPKVEPVIVPQVPNKRGRKQKEPKSFGEVANILETPTKKIEADDIEYRINLVKSTIKDKEIARTKKENAYLRRKLDELERELEDLDNSSEEEPVYIKPIKSSTKPIKVPNQPNQPEVKYMSRTEMMKQFGF